MTRPSLASRLCALTVALVFTLAAIVAGTPARCLLAQHCARCEESPVTAIGFGGCPQMSPATPAAPDESPVSAAILSAPVAARAIAVTEKVVPVAARVFALPAFPDGAPPGGLALRI